jgi:hypothetical protein
MLKAKIGQSRLTSDEIPITFEDDMSRIHWQDECRLS